MRNKVRKLAKSNFTFDFKIKQLESKNSAIRKKPPRKMVESYDTENALISR